VTKPYPPPQTKRDATSDAPVVNRCQGNVAEEDIGEDFTNHRPRSKYHRAVYIPSTWTTVTVTCTYNGI